MEQAIESSITVEITVSSNNPEQTLIDESSGLNLIQSLLPEVLQAYHQTGLLIDSQLVQFIQPLQDAIAVKQHQESSLTSQVKKWGKHKYHIEKGVRAYPCSYISCTESFSNAHKRADHHKTHFSKEFFDKLDVNDKVACPECGKIVVASIAAILSHMFKKGCNKSQ